MQSAELLQNVVLWLGRYGYSLRMAHSKLGMPAAVTMLDAIVDNNQEIQAIMDVFAYS